MKKVTICIPTYNSENTIRETIVSLLNQTYKNYTIKIVDNCSTDKTREIVNEINSDKIILIENDINVGGEGNFTRCMQLAEGDYTAIYHADDIYNERIIEEQVNVLENPAVAAVATHSSLINEYGEIIGERFIPPELNNDVVNIMNREKFINLVCKYGNFITCPSVMARSSIYKEKIKIWNGKDYKTSADLDVWLRITEVGSLALITKKLINYRASTNSLSFNMKKVRCYRHDLFLVLDVLRKNVSEENGRYIDFLEFKDVGLRKLNLIKSREKKNIEIALWDPHLLRIALTSKWHFKYYFSSLLLQVVYSVYSRISQ